MGDAGLRCNGPTLAGVAVGVVAVLDDPPGLPELGVNLLAGILLGAGEWGHHGPDTPTVLSCCEVRVAMAIRHPRRSD